MKQLNLNDYSDTEIVDALTQLKSYKFLSVMNALGEIAKRQEARGKIVSKRISDSIIDRMVEDLLKE